MITFSAAAKLFSELRWALRVIFKRSGQLWTAITFSKTHRQTCQVDSRIGNTIVHLGTSLRSQTNSQFLRKSWLNTTHAIKSRDPPLQESCLCSGITLRAKGSTSHVLFVTCAQGTPRSRKHDFRYEFDVFSVSVDVFVIFQFFSKFWVSSSSAPSNGQTTCSAR